MGLFDKPLVKAEPVDEYEEKLRELKAQKIRIIRSIGEKFVEVNKDEDMSSTPYAELIKQLKENEKETDHTEKQQLASRGLRKCESCGAELPIDSAFCNKCGASQGKLETELVKTGKICPKCGTKLNDDDVFCISCGYKL